MHRNVSINKLPKFCAQPEGLMPGDILIFDRNPTRMQSAGAKITYKQQGLLNEPGGHREAEHAGFIVEVEGHLKLAHLVGKGFVLEDLDAKYLKRTTNIFRPRKHQEALAYQLQVLVQERIHHEHEAKGGLFLLPEDVDPTNKETFPLEGGNADSPLRQRITRWRHKFQLNWSIGVAIRSFLHRLVSSLRIVNRDPNNKHVKDTQQLPHRSIAKDSICSKYVADSYITACYQLTKDDLNSLDYRRYFMNISSFTTPKTLQAYLYRNTNYDLLLMPNAREKLLDNLVAKIHKEAVRLKASTNSEARSKGVYLEQALNKFAPEAFDNVVDASIALLKYISQLLLINTGLGVKTPASYKRIMAYAKSQGIYQEYVNRYFVSPERKHVSELAEDRYQYSSSQAKLYSRFRRIGFSDKQARFEADEHPSFGDWYKLSVVRNSLITSTVVGFFAWVLPRGLYRAHQVEKRNRELFTERESTPLLIRK